MGPPYSNIFYYFQQYIFTPTSPNKNFIAYICDVVLEKTEILNPEYARGEI